MTDIETKIDLYVGVLEGFFSDPPDERDEDWAEGLESWRETIQQINTMLANNDLPTYEEAPAFAEEPGVPVSIPRTWYHALFMAMAYRGLDPTWRASDEWNADADDKLTEEQVGRLVDAGSHFLVHPLDEEYAYYVPVDFPEPLADDDLYISSSHRLLAEVIAVAPALGVRLDDGRDLQDGERERIHAGDRGTSWTRALKAWLAYYDVARASIRNSMLIFSH